MAVEIKLAYDEKNEIRKLFAEYTEMLCERDPAAAICLKAQHHDDEECLLLLVYCHRFQKSSYHL